MRNDIQIPPGCEIIQGWRWQTTDEMRRMVACGEAIEIDRRLNEDTGVITILFRRLKPPPARWKRPAIRIGIALSAFLLVSSVLWWLIWLVVTAITANMIAALLCGTGAWLLWTRRTHSGGCVGLHCAGCKG